MNERLAAIGERLRTAREAQGLAVEQVAARLRLMNRQVAAMESGDFSALGQAVFARGFVRNYAKLLGLNAEEIVAQMRGELSQEGPPKAEMGGALQAAKRWRSAWLWIGLAVVVVIALPLALYGWLTSGDAESDHAVGQAVVSGQASRLSAVPSEKPETAVGPLRAAPQSPAAMSGTPAVAVPLEAKGVALHFLADAWVDIRDAQGKQLAGGLYHTGQELTLKQGFPLSFVIGDAGQVQVSYAGHIVDLRPYTAVNVARFSMAADGATERKKP